MSSTSVRSISSARPTPSSALVLTTVAEESIEPEETEPEVAHLTTGIPLSHDVPPPRAFPYITHNIDSDGDDVQEIASTPFGSPLAQHVCRNMNDVEANEAVINKNWFRQVADAEAPSLQSEMGMTTRLHMTRPQWVTQKLRSEAALWSDKKDNGPAQASSSRSSQLDEGLLPLHALLKPSIESVEAFLADETKEMELAAAQHLLTMSQNKPSSASDSSSEEKERQRQDEEYQRMVEEQQANEEDQDEDYWRSYNEQLYWSRLMRLAVRIEFFWSPAWLGGMQQWPLECKRLLVWVRIRTFRVFNVNSL